MAANTRVDPILVACLVDSSAALLYEWNQILQAYISPLLQRIAAIHTNSRNNRVSQETIRIGIVSYSDRNVHPDPILARRFFAPVSLITRELKDEPTSLGLGHTAPGINAGMAVLEGYVAVLEMFDAVAETRPLPPQIMENAELPPYEPALYLLHIAAVQPDNASKPIWNQNHLLDDVTWSSLPAEILKRKIRHNIILTKPIPQLQEFYKNIYRNPENHGISILKSSHRLLFFNLPSDVKIIPQKRAASDNVDIEAAPVPVPPSNTPGSQLATPHQAHPVPDAQGQANNNESSQQAHQRTPFDMNRLRTIFFSLESDIQNAKATLDQAKLSGKPQSELDAIENDLKLKTQQKMGLIHYSYRMAQKQAASGVAQHPQSTNSSAQMPKLSTHPHPNANTPSTGQSAPNTISPSNPFPNMLAPTRPGMNAQMEKLIAERMRPPVVAAAPTGVQLQSTQSQLQPQPLESQSQPHQTQLQSQPQLSQPQLQPQSQPQPQSQSQPQLQSQSKPQPQPQPQTQLPTHSQVQPQPQMHPLSSHQFQPQAGAAPPPGQVTSPLPPHPDILADKPILANFPKRWQGSFAWSLGPREAVVRVALYTQDTTLHPESWPPTLRFVQGHAPINSGQIQIWLKEKSAVVSLVSHTPYAGNDEATIQNYRLFKLVRDWCQSKNVLLYCQFDMPEAPQGSGALLFPLQGSSPVLSGETFVCMIFNKTPLPVEVLRLPPSMAPSQGANQNDAALNVQANSSAAMHNMSNIASDAYLPQQKMQALASFQKKQELAQQANMQRNMMQNLAGIPFGGANGPNINQLLQAGQQQSNSSDQNLAGNGGLNLAPQAQAPLVHRQGAPGTANLTAAQMAQLLQFGMNRNPDASG